MRDEIERIAGEAGAERVAVAFQDYGSGTAWSLRGDAWFHAASTIKVPILMGAMGAVHAGDLPLRGWVHVRNRFPSAVGGTPFRVAADRDADSGLYARLGRTARVEELMHRMITVSSNLATNLLVEVVGIDRLRAELGALGLDGVELRRGVEDDAAYEAGISNRVTARGLLRALRMIHEGTAWSAELSGRMLEVLHEQEFRGGIPAGLPEGTHVANKTGEISTAAHDAAIVYPAGRRPYLLVVLTEWAADADGERRRTLARIAAAVHAHLTEEQERRTDEEGEEDDG